MRPSLGWKTWLTRSSAVRYLPDCCCEPSSPALSVLVSGWITTNALFLSQASQANVQSRRVPNRHKRPIGSHFEVCEILPLRGRSGYIFTSPILRDRTRMPTSFAASATHDGFQVAEARHEANSCSYAAL